MSVFAAVWATVPVTTRMYYVNWSVSEATEQISPLSLSLSQTHSYTHKRQVVLWSFGPKIFQFFLVLLWCTEKNIYSQNLAVD